MAIIGMQVYTIVNFHIGLLLLLLPFWRWNINFFIKIYPIDARIVNRNDVLMRHNSEVWFLYKTCGIRAYYMHTMYPFVYNIDFDRNDFPRSSVVRTQISRLADDFINNLINDTDPPGTIGGTCVPGVRRI